MIYIAVLLVACIILCAALCNMIVTKQLQNSKQACARAFDRAEANFSQSLEKLDNYILNLYSDPYLKKDFLYFFGHSLTSYFTDRNEETANMQKDFLQNLRTFVSDNNDFVDMVVFQVPELTNVVYFSEKSSVISDYQLGAPATVLDSKTDDISSGYIYSKRLINPDNLNEQLGEIHFLLRSEKLFSGIGMEELEATAVMSRNGRIYFQSDGDNDQEKYQWVYEHSGESEGIIKDRVFSKVYYFVNASTEYGYKMITLVDTRSIAQENAGVLLLIILGTLLVFVVMALLLAVRMNYDARYLNRIVNAIQHAQSGRFLKINVDGRKDEYSVIAQELNDMSKRLEEYIRTEYILKLKQKETEMKALQHQINPHFLYNSLEIIRSCALVNNDEKVAEAVYNLGGMYRDIVKGGDTVTIDKELEILTKYLKIMEFKYNGSFFYQLDVDPSVREMLTIKLWMQPLVENFFVHGFDKNSGFNLLIVNGREEKDRFVIDIINNGFGIEEEKIEELNLMLSEEEETEPESSDSVGMKNVYHRLRYFYGNKLEMRIFNNHEAGITVSVRVYRESKEEKECIEC